MANDLYEAEPQPADTVFSSPYVPNANPTRTISIVPENNDDIIAGIMGNVRGLPTGANTLSPDMASATPTGGINWNSPWLFGGDTPTPSNPFAGALGAFKSGADVSGAVGSAASAVSALSGNTLSATIAAYFVRAIVVILGFVFVAVGLSMLGAQTRMGNSIIREVKKVV